MFKPKIQPITIEDDGETITLHVRQAAANEILDAETEAQLKKKTNKERIRDIFSKYVVNEDGTPIKQETVDEIMVARVGAFKKISDAVVEKIGLNAAVAKND